MGSVEAVKEEIRSVGWEAALETLWQDVRYGLRQLKRNPGFTVVVVITLALGIGANSAVFSILNGLFLRALPVPEPERVVAFSSGSSPTRIIWPSVSKRNRSKASPPASACLSRRT